MILNLFKKEVAEHWLATLGMLFLSTVCAVFLVALTRLNETASIFESQKIFLCSVATIAAYFLCNRLVRREYQSMTQLFLESLPISRVAMISVKLLLGWGLILSLVTGSLLLCAILGRHNESLNLRFLAILFLSTIAFASWIYLFFFLTALLGRYRFPIYLFLLISVIYLQQTVDIELQRAPPLSLVLDRFGYERDVIPWWTLSQTAIMIGGMVVISYLLALVREGSLAGRLSERMSQREKLFITTCLICQLSFFSVLDERKRPDPFRMHGTVTKASDLVRVSVEETDDESVLEMAEYLSSELSDLVRFLRLTNFPQVWVLHRPDFDSSHFERGTVADHHSLIVRGHLTHPQFDRQRFLAFLVREFLSVSTAGRAEMEERSWVLDGVGDYWAERDREGTKLNADSLFCLRASVGTVDGFEGAELSRWFQFRRKVGKDLANSVAWSGLAVFEQRYGRDKLRALLQQVFRSDLAENVLVGWFESRYPMKRLFLKICDEEFEQFVATWQTQLAQWRTLRAAEIQSLPRITGNLTFLRTTEVSRQLRYAWTSEPTLKPSDEAVLIYTPLVPFEFTVDEHTCRREALNPQQPTGSLPDSFSRGERVIATFSVYVPELQANRISGWKVYEAGE